MKAWLTVSVTITSKLNTYHILMIIKTYLKARISLHP